MSSRTVRAMDIAIAAWILALFHFLGNATDTTAFGSSAFGWMIVRWADSTLYAGDYSHGWLVPLVSAYALWTKRTNLRDAEKRTWWPAVIVVFIAFTLHVAGMRAQLPRISLLALMLLLWSIPAYLYGKRIAHLILFPVAYLIFCIPLNFLDNIAFPLRLLATKLSVLFLNGISIPAFSAGTAILSPDGAFSLEVADPCSGIKSLLALTAITVAYAYFFQNRTWQRVILVIMSGGLAVAGNVVRIVTLAIFATRFGQEKAFEFYHEYSGYIVFIVAVLLMLTIDKVLQKVDSKLNPSHQPE